MRPAEDLEPLQRMDPLTRGSLFHAVQTAFYRRLQAEDALPVTAPAGCDARWRCSTRWSNGSPGEQYELLAPAIDRVWHDEIGAIRRDLRLWVDEIARAGGEWVPLRFEWAFGYQDGGALAVGRDPKQPPRSRSIIDGRFQLHGSIDLVEEHAADRRAARHRSQDREVSRQGAHDGRRRRARCSRCCTRSRSSRRSAVRSSKGRLYYATTAGGYRDVRIPLTPQARRLGVEVLEIIDRAIETGFLAPAPDGEGVHLVRLPAGVRADRRASHQPVQGARAAGRSARRCGGSHERRLALRDQLPDRDRQLIREGLDDTVVVEAAAGTGKTTELVRGF